MKKERLKKSVVDRVESKVFNYDDDNLYYKITELSLICHRLSLEQDAATPPWPINS